MRNRSLTTQPVASLACDIKEDMGIGCSGQIHLRAVFLVAYFLQGNYSHSQTRKKEKDDIHSCQLSRCIQYCISLKSVIYADQALS